MIERFLGLTLAEESGQTMAEYAVVLGVITIAIVVTLGLLSTAVQNLLTNVISVIWPRLTAARPRRIVAARGGSGGREREDGSRRRRPRPGRGGHPCLRGG